MRKHVFTVATTDPRALDDFLADRLVVDASLARAWIDAGAVQIGGRRADRFARLSPGMRVIVRQPEMAQLADPTAALHVVYRDEDLLVVDKPPGMLSQPSSGEMATSLDARVRGELPEARLMHRLDRDASGLVVFALRAAIYAALQFDFAGDEIERRYLAVASGVVPAGREVRLRIARDPSDARRRVALPENAPGGQEARTRLVPVGWTGVGTALSIELHSGRTHQIRVHAAGIGHPLVGDRLYGGPEHERLMLHAVGLVFAHPRTGERLALAASIPPGFTVS